MYGCASGTPKVPFFELLGHLEPKFDLHWKKVFQSSFKSTLDEVGVRASQGVSTCIERMYWEDVY